MLEAILAILSGYFLGSFPSAHIAARLVKGQDIHQVGNGNMGTLNTMREIGLLPGLLVLLADMLKGILAIMLARWLDTGQIVIFITGMAAVLGHIFPPYLGFKGGRGSVTCFGVLAALAPLPAAISFGILIIVMLITSNARLALTAAFIALLPLAWAFGVDKNVLIYAGVMPAMLGIYMLVADRHKLSRPETRRNLIIDHDYTPWQSRRKK